MTSIVWDMGGTLFDTYPSIDNAFRELLLEHGVDVEFSEISALTRVSRDHAIETLSERSGIPVSLFEERYERVKQTWEVHPAPLMAGALDVAAACTESGGKNLVVTHRDRESAQQLLDTTGFIADDMICASDGYPRKPDPTMIQVILSRNDIEARDCVAVGDRGIDMEAALAIGVTPYYLVTAGISTTYEGAQSIGSLFELLPHLQ